ncbi:MAG: hypothetical protein WA790_00165 [Sulfitobacter sp.]
MDYATLAWCEDACRKESKRMEDTGKKHPEDSEARGRCFARARSLHQMAERFQWKRSPDMTRVLREADLIAQEEQG